MSIELAARALCRQFPTPVHAAALFVNLPGATVNDLLLLRALYQNECGHHLEHSAESLLSESLWSPDREVAEAALLCARAMCVESMGADTASSVELLLGLLEHPSPRWHARAAAIVWDALVAGHCGDESNLVLTKLLDSLRKAPTEGGLSLTHSAGCVTYLLQWHNPEVLTALLECSSKLTVTDVFVANHLDVEFAGSTLLGLLARTQENGDNTASPQQRTALDTLCGVIRKHDGAPEALAEVMFEKALAPSEEHAMQWIQQSHH